MADGTWDFKETWDAYMSKQMEVDDDEVSADPHKNALRALTNEISLLGEQQCAACSGFGHSLRDCFTNQKLTVMGESMTYARPLIA